MALMYVGTCALLTYICYHIRSAGGIAVLEQAMWRLARNEDDSWILGLSCLRSCFLSLEALSTTDCLLNNTARREYRHTLSGMEQVQLLSITSSL